MLGSRLGAGSSFPAPQSGLVLSGHTLSHVALSPGALSSSGVGWLREPSPLWKELGAGIRQRLGHICLQTSAYGEMYVWGPGAEGGLGGSTLGNLGFKNHSCSPLPLPSSPPPPRMCSWLRSSPKVRLQLLSIQCPLQQVASQESVMWAVGCSPLSTVPGLWSAGGRGGGFYPLGYSC